MKSVVADYRYKVFCLRIIPKLASPVYLTDHVRNLAMGGNAYLSSSGYEFTGYTSEASMSPGMVEIDGKIGLAGILYDQLASGVFDGARAYLFATTWINPIEDEEEITTSFCGKLTLKDKNWTLEETGLIDALNQTVGDTYTAPCERTYGDTGCTVSLASVTVTGTLTGVASSSIFTDSARLEASDWFGAGTIRFTSGLNAGLKPIEVKSFASGVIEAVESFYYPPAIGDTYEMVKGCRKRESDCKAQTPSNILNFFGFTRIPAGSTYAQVGGQ